MHCTNCKKGMIDTWTCPLCGGNWQKLNFHRYVRWNIGDVLLLNDDGSEDASIEEMIDRCESIIEECYSKFQKKGRKKLERFNESNVYCSTVVRDFYMAQFE